MARFDIENTVGRFAFLIIFLVGTGLITSVRTLGEIKIDSHESAYFAAIIAVSLIFILGFYYWKNRKLRNLLYGGDDLYYLGLLFTLVSLIYTLVAVFTYLSDSEVAQRTQLLIENFGIALISTVAGILGRIILHNLAENKNEAGSSLSGDYEQSEMLEMRGKMREATDAFSHFTRVTQTFAESTVKHTQKQVEQFNERIEDSAQASIAKTESVWNEFSDKMESHKSEAINELEMYLSSLQTLTNAAKNESFSANTQIQENVKLLGDLANNIKSLNSSLEGLAKNTEGVENRLRDLGTTAQNAKSGLDTRIADIAKSMEDFSKSCENFKKATAEFQESFSNSISSQETATKNILEQQKLGQKAAEMLNKSVKDAQLLLEKLQRQLPGKRKFWQRFRSRNLGSQSNTNQ